MSSIRNKKNRFFLFFLLLLILFLGASFVFAQEKELEVKGYPQIPGAEAPDQVGTPLPQYFKYVLNFLLSLVGLFIFGVLVYGGFKYLTSGHSPIKLADAKKQIFAALLGLVIILCSYLILHTINPQLLIFQVPEWLRVEPPPFVKPLPPLEEQTLYAQEIPVGKLIDGGGEKYGGVLLETRLVRIKEVLGGTKEVSKEVKKLATELSNLVALCECENRVAGGCNTGDCGSPPCTSNCSCEGDPCPNRGAINEKRRKLEGALSDSKELKGLSYWQKKIDTEINGSEKIQGLGVALENLKSAERTMKKCPSSFSERGQGQTLLNSGNFWQYKKGLEGQEIVKKVEIQPIWDDVKTGEDAFVFYCSEVPFEVSLEEGGVPEEEGSEGVASEIETIESVRVYCETEIPAGEAIDEAEAFAAELLKELQDTLANVTSQIESAKAMIELTSENGCTISNCTPSMEDEWGGCCDPYECNCVWVPEEGDEDWWDFPWSPWDPVIPMLSPPVVYAAWECDTCCGYEYCTGCECQCRGDACPFGEISNNLSRINTALKRIEILYSGGEIEGKEIKGIKNLTEGVKVPDEFNKFKIVAKLNESRLKFGDPIRGCLNAAEDWTRALFEGKILEKHVLTCEEAKDVCWDIEKDYQCYGEGNPEAYTNYFCGEVKTP